MATDNEALSKWKKEFPDATEEEVERVKELYSTPDKKAKEEPGKSPQAPTK